MNTQHKSITRHISSIARYLNWKKIAIMTLMAYRTYPLCLLLQDHCSEVYNSNIRWYSLGYIA